MKATQIFLTFEEKKAFAFLNLLEFLHSHQKCLWLGYVYIISSASNANFCRDFCDQLKSVSDHLIFSFETQPWLLQQFTLRNNRKQVIALEHRTETRGISR